MVTGTYRETKKYPCKDGYSGKRYEFFCGSYFKAVREGRRKECKCLRNGVFQDMLEPYIARYLDDTGQRLQLLTQGMDLDSLTTPLKDQAADHWQEFALGLERLQLYLQKHHLEEYRRAVADNSGEEATEYEYITGLIDCYRKNFDPSSLRAELESLEAEHDALMKDWRDLPTQRAKDKAKQRFAELEERMDCLKQQMEDAGSVVEQHYRDMLDLQEAIEEAKRAFQAEAGEHALRQKAEAVRGVIQRIECTFTATGKTKGGWGKKNSQLVKVTIYPVVGDAVEFSADDSKGTLLYSSAHSFM
jgi:hypothetical protein